jgi:hypothetical protein
MEKELLEKINKKIKEIKTLRNSNNKDLKFKAWHISTVNLLKMLPSEFIKDTSDFKKLTFADTKYHRGARPFNPSDNTRYIEDLDNATKILKKITVAKKEKKKEKASPIKKDAPKKESKPEKESRTKK